MPHFTAITLDRFINTGDSRSVDRPNQCTTTVVKASSTNSKPWDYLRLEKRNSMPSTRKPVMSPEHYATPESTPGPDCHEPSVVKKDDASNLKNITDGVEISADEKGSGNHSVASESSSHVLLTVSNSIISEHVNGAIINECRNGCPNLENGIVAEARHNDVRNGHAGENDCEMPATDTLCRESDSEDLCDPHESMSSIHKDGEEFEVQIHSSRLSTHNPGVEFYDAWEELSSVQNSVKAALEDELKEIVVFEEGNDVRNGHIGEDGCEMPDTNSLGRESDSEDLCDPHKSMSCCKNHKDEEEFGIQIHSSSLATPTPIPGVEFYDAWEELSSVQNSVKTALEDELREIRLSLVSETEKRKQAEEALENMQRRWERMREHLSRVGLTLPSILDNDPAEDLVCQQIQVIRFVSESIGRGIAKAEAITEIEYQVEAKNFEITRLCDRVHYYETTNREMSQRKQEVAAERARRVRERRKWRQRWVWGSIGVSVSIGIVVVACNYLQTGKSSSTEIT